MQKNFEKGGQRNVEHAELCELSVQKTYGA